MPDRLPEEWPRLNPEPTGRRAIKRWQHRERGAIEATFSHGYNMDGEPNYLTVSKFDQSQPHGSVSDCEDDEHDGRESDVDDEPSLCGITAGEGAPGDANLEADLGSFDRMIDQRKSTRTAGWSVHDGEINEATI
jgi:hypothetical protein